MLVLAIDTSGKQGSLALAQCEAAGECTTLEVVPLEGGTFSAQLIPQIAALLSMHGFSKQNIDALAAASGPGSFTGLRVGLAAIKALADVLNKPIAAVSLLEAVALAGETRGEVMAALDAGRNDVYAGRYRAEDKATMISERLLTREEFLSEAQGRKVISPDAVILDAACAAGIAVEEVARPRADAIARLGGKKILAGDTVSPEALEANYIRRSDAELFVKRA